MGDELKKRRKEESKTGYIALMVLCAVVFVGAAGVLFYQQWQKKQTEDMLSGLSEEPTETEVVEEEDDPLYGIEIPVKELNWKNLKKENEDIYAWVYVPGTKVDYPILQDPEDDTYYLNHNIDGSTGYPGCIYTEATYNAKDFNDNLTVLYGHNMKDDSIFGSLHDFEDPETFSGEHYIYIYTEDARVLVYRMFGAYEYTSNHLLANEDMTNPDIFDQYLIRIFNNVEMEARTANIRHDISVTKEDKVITLLTCTKDSRDDLRYVVQGVLLGETTY